MSATIATMNWAEGMLDVPGLRSSEKKLGQLKGVFRNEDAWQKLDPETVVYRVWWWEPEPLGTEGGLLWGTSEIVPGRVGQEYFMTQGHRHTIRNRAEFYGTVRGSGRLLLRDESGKTWFEEMSPGSLHYIPGYVWHRTINTGDVPLRFTACWHSDAGHDYEIPGGKGFGARFLEENGKPVFKTEE